MKNINMNKKMNTKLSISIVICTITICLFLILGLNLNCTSAISASPKSSPNGESTDARAYERRNSAGSNGSANGRTFLDTLNHGKEVALSAEELPSIEFSGGALPPVTAVLSGAGSQEGAEPRFRIQILASSQVDMVRKEKIKAEAAITDHPVLMASEQSLYKLYIGDFKTKAEAEAALPAIKKRGYADAWIVNK